MIAASGRRLRTGTAGALLALAVVGPAGPSLVAAQGADGVRREVVCTFTDERITESSGLARSAGLLWTVNDSGDGPLLYGVDPRTGRTVRERVFSDQDPVDVEGLAAGPDGSLWVADVGDNRRSRGAVTVHEVRRTGEVRHFELAYPDGPHDAETVLVHPRTGRLLVVTKVPFGGGSVYRAPGRLQQGQVHRLRRVASAPGLVTDGAFTPDGRHVVLRDYGRATVHRFPGFDQVGAFPLPRQEQGEGLTVVGRRVWVSSEGSGSRVLSVRLPRRVTADDAAPAPSAEVPADGTTGPSGSGSAQPPGTEVPPDDPGGTGAWTRPAGLTAAVGALVGGGLVGGWWVRARRRRGRRTL